MEYGPDPPTKGAPFTKQGWYICGRSVPRKPAPSRAAHMTDNCAAMLSEAGSPSRKGVLSAVAMPAPVEKPATAMDEQSTPSCSRSPFLIDQ